MQNGFLLYFTERGTKRITAKSEPSFIRILETESLSDIALIRSALDDRNIRYFLQGENMRHLRPLDPVVLVVEDKDVEQVRELLKPLQLNYSWLTFDPPKAKR